MLRSILYMVLPWVRWCIIVHLPLKSKPHLLLLGTQRCWFLQHDCQGGCLQRRTNGLVPWGVLRPLLVFRATTCPGSSVELEDVWQDKCEAGRWGAPGRRKDGDTQREKERRRQVERLVRVTGREEQSREGGGRREGRGESCSPCLITSAAPHIVLASFCGGALEPTCFCEVQYHLIIN